MAPTTTPHEVPAVYPFPVHRFSVEQYQRLGEMGVLGEDDRVELLEGWIVTKMNLNPPHSATVQMINDALRRLLPAGWCVRVQDAITTSDSEPEPDLAIVRGTHRDYVACHPQPDDVQLIVEVADSSLPRDRFKCRVYGKAGIPAYWIINLADRRVEVYTDPTGLDPNPGYRRREDFGPTDQVTLSVNQICLGNLPVSNLLP